MHLLPGTILAQRYRIDALLGEGGMGSVYRATDWNGAGWAIKVIRPDAMLDRESRRRIEDEARIGLNLRHPHIRQIWELAEDPYSRLPFLAMELLYGEDMASRLRWRGPFSVDETRALIGQLCDALKTAHASGIIHRDLKPENLFLSATQAGEALKVLDFGIAKLMSRSVNNSQVIGTPAWMAPEQLGQDKPIGPHTDVWAVGLLTFFALTGRSYWPAANSGSVDQPKIILDAIDVSRRVPASERAAAYHLAERIPRGAFDVWFARCIALEPQDRYPDIIACWVALRDALNAAGDGLRSSLHVMATEPVDEEAMIAAAVSEIQRRLPRALTAAEAMPAPAAQPDPISSQPRPRVSLIKGVTPTPAPVSPRAHSPTPIPVVPSVVFPSATPPRDKVIIQVAPGHALQMIAPAMKMSRFGAMAVDLVLTGFVACILGFFGLVLDKDLGVLLFFLTFVAYPLRDIIGGGRSIGKRIFELEIVDAKTGLPVGLGRALGRQCVSLELIPILGLLDGILVLTRDDGRRSGDLLFQTQIVRRVVSRR